MKRVTLYSLIIVLCIGAIYLFKENTQLHDKVKEMEIVSDDLRVVKEIKDLNSYNIEQVASEDVDGNYNSWNYSSQIADKLYEDSDGKFKIEWGLFLGEMAQKKDIDPFIVYELLRTETGGTFDPNVIGPETRFGQAFGMAQFMKNTAPWIAEKAKLPYEDKLLFDPLYSIQLSIEYLGFLYNEYDNWDYALTAYNRGMYGLEKYIQQNGHAESMYAIEIQENADKFKQVAYNF